MFVTNNASRPPAEVAESLTGDGRRRPSPDDVLTSPQAAAVMLVRPASGRDARCWWSVRLAGRIGDARPGWCRSGWPPTNPVAVVQGHSPDTGWRELAEACIALRAGADWVACNVDSTLPTDRGLLPGNGAMVAALVAATGLQPRVAGKPARPLLDAAVRLVDAKRPLVVGDRLDTDIACAVAAAIAQPAGLHRCLHLPPICWPRCPNSDRPIWRSTCAAWSRRITRCASRQRRRRAAAWNGR